MLTKKHVFLLAVAGLVGLDSGAAFAQLEEIVVTAQRRLEDIQSTPISVAAFSPDRLNDLDATNLEQLATFVPNLSLGVPGSGAANKTAISIRGVSETFSGVNTAPAVGIYIDDVYYGQPSLAFLQLLDVERVEVLRGPQGTLFGKTSLGGAIRYITRKPEFDDVEGYVNSTVGDYDRFDISGAVNIPLSDNVAVRVKAATLNRDGYVTRLDDGVSLGAQDSQYISAQLRWAPTDRLDFNFTVDHNLRDTDNGPTKAIDFFNYNGGFAPTGGDISPPVFTPGAAASVAWNSIWAGTPNEVNRVVTDSLYTVAGGVMPRLRSESTGVNLNISLDVSDSVNLRSITGYRKVEDFNVSNFDDTDSALDSAFDYTREAGVDFWSQEFQLTGTTDRLNWTAGLYYSVEESFQNDIQNGWPIISRAFSAVNRRDRLDLENKHTGIFAQGTFSITDKLGLTLGVRYSEDDKDYRAAITSEWRADYAAEAVAFGLPPLTLIPPFQPLTGCADGSDISVVGSCIAGPEVSVKTSLNATTSRIALEYEWTDNVMTYVSASEGFKVGGPNDQYTTINQLFDDEEALSYEIGLRSELMDSRLRINATYFVLENENKQIVISGTDTSPDVPGSGFVNPCTQRCILNAGDTEISGLELDLTFAPTSRLLLRASVGTLDAKWTRVVPAGPSALDSIIGLAPELSYNIGGSYSVPLSSGGSLSFLLDYGYKDEQESLEGILSLTLPDYGLTTLRMRYEDPDGNWSASIFCNNCTDEEYITGGNAFAGSTDNSPLYNYKPATSVDFTNGKSSPFFIVIPDNTYVMVGSPRMWGVDFRYMF